MHSDHQAKADFSFGFKFLERTGWHEEQEEESEWTRMFEIIVAYICVYYHKYILLLYLYYVIFEIFNYWNALGWILP